MRMILAMAALCAALPAAPVHAQVTCTQAGIQTVCSNGQTFTNFGNMTSDNFGNTWTGFGNTTVGPGGPYTSFGNTTISPQGSYQTFGNTTIGPGGHSCMRVGIQTICN